MRTNKLGSRPTQSWIHIQLEGKKRIKNVKIFSNWKWCDIFYGIKRKNISVF